MRLIGSRTEFLRREELKQLDIIISKNVVISEFLVKKFPSINSVHVLACVRDQLEDEYRIIVNGSVIVEFELSFEDQAIHNLKEMSVSDYSRSLKNKSDKLDLSIVLDLFNK